ncbi:lysozyme inhibitor LprI family protein [Chitinophaga sp. HK235]|uniref:lysozyme inhibitor LprI family protein n=1 Tax=Chitinophaga sp. HK235 TaxID=2952571 RepID=UPI001BA5607A|nr:lysozyme inhibitor LprI family protein [Chitinophaga sp. HK235]
MRNLILILAVFLCSNAYAQSRQAALDSLEIRYQHCLSKGSNSYSCALVYYKQLDSLLHSTLQRLYTQIDPGKLRALQTEQGAWEEKREEYFRKIDERVEKMHKSTMNGLDDDMISTDNKAAYVKDRVTALLDLQI